MPGYRFQPFAAVSEACRQNSVILNSPSKSFNIAGLQTANIICAQPEWRRRLDRAININEVCDLNPFGPVALKAAYNESEDWIDALNQYLWGNYQTLCAFVAENLPQWRVCRLEGTYLPWVDITAAGMTSQQYADLILEKAKVWVNPGTMYGPQSGEGYIRLNIATQRSRLMEALERIKDAL
jgi:cystathionine beta-lyase